jgi:hypothetical protein
MNLLEKKRLRDKKKEQERIRKLVQSELFRKPQRAYLPSSKKLTIILFVALLIAVPYIYLSTDVMVHNQCALMTGIECNNLEIQKEKITFQVHNYLKDEYNITLKLQDCEDVQNQVLRPNREFTFSFNCAYADEIVKKEVYMTYVGYSGLAHDKTGHIIGKITAEEEAE